MNNKKLEFDNYENDDTKTEEKKWGIFEPVETTSQKKKNIPQLSISPDMIEKFLSESQDISTRIENNLLHLEKNPYDQEIVSSLFRDIHSLKGNAGFFGYRDLEELTMQMESLLENIRSTKVKVSSRIINQFLETLDYINKYLNSINPEKPDQHYELPEKDRLIHSIMHLSNMKPKSGILKPIGEILVEMGETTEDDVDQALESQNLPLGELLVKDGKVNRDAVEKALEIQRQNTPQSSGSYTGFKRKDIRVDTEKLDRLFDLMGELITAQSLVTNNPDLADFDIPNFRKASRNLNKVSREIQEISMSIRMVPLEATFNKMSRLVRDLSRKANKNIEFHIRGAETEMDRNVIELISDPLIHILRNSVDHGIETKAERKQKGKEPTAHIQLTAKYEGNEIWIIIEDDGAGLNRDKIINKAMEKGLVRKKPESYSDDEVWNFIFEPGFSTASEITDISGRGVGMDVVKRNIEKIRGRIDIKSQPGSGTSVFLKIPLTLAIMDGMSIRVGKTKYSIPIADIIRSFKIIQSQVSHTEEGNEIIKVREEIIPLIRLNEIFDIEKSMTDLEEGIMIVVEHQSKKAGLFADEIIGNQQIVVKSMPDFLGKIDGIMGCSILGNGEISLILDVGSMIDKFLD